MTTTTGYTEHPRRQPSKAAKRRVRDAFDAGSLAAICVLDDFSDYAERIDLPPAKKSGRQRFFYYQDNGSDILAVAHLDSVQSNGTCTVVDTGAGPLACSGTLDDRLGAYVILEMLPKLGITCDWLLTTDEEIGASTAADFYPADFEDKTYKWMFQFDRGGTDVVMYHYETAELVDLVEDCGARVGQGSFSDICLLDHLGCSGFNWGVGYQDYHGPRSHAWLDDTFRMVARFVKFYNANATTSLPYEDSWCSWPTKATDSDQDEKTWWSRQDLLVADCGHAVDVNDPDTFIEGHGVTVCTKCGTIPADVPAPVSILDYLLDERNTA